jgi:hypothetical protein
VGLAHGAEKTLARAWFMLLRKPVRKRLKFAGDDTFPLKFANRIEAWLPLFTKCTISDLKAAQPEWCHLLELRHERNKFVHAPGPTAGLSFHDVHRGLNSARTGAGGLLATLRRWQGLAPLGFLERLQRAPEVKFVSALSKKRPKR